MLFDQFKGWSVDRCKKQGSQPQPFDQFGHIPPHTWQKQSSISYYPVNFNQYNWMPADNDAGPIHQAKADLKHPQLPGINCPTQYSGYSG